MVLQRRAARNALRGRCSRGARAGAPSPQFLASPTERPCRQRFPYAGPAAFLHPPNIGGIRRPQAAALVQPRPWPDMAPAQPDLHFLLRALLASFGEALVLANRHYAPSGTKKADPLKPREVIRESGSRESGEGMPPTLARGANGARLRRSSGGKSQRPLAAGCASSKRCTEGGGWGIEPASL